MLAGCSSNTLLSPRHRLRAESPPQFQACYFQLPTSMNTQRLDLPRTSFTRKDAASTRPSQPIKPVGVSLSVEKIDGKKTKGCSLKHNVRLPPLSIAAPAVAVAAASGTATSAFVEERMGGEFWERRGDKRSLERLTEDEEEESYVGRAKKKRGGCDEFAKEEGDELSLSHIGGGAGGSFWFHPHFSAAATATSVPFPISCSGEEDDRICVIPGGVVSPRLPISDVPWIDSVVKDITDIGKVVEKTSYISPEKESPGGSSSTWSESHQSPTLGLNETAATATTSTSGHQVGGNCSSRRSITHHQPSLGAAAREELDEEKEDGYHRDFDLVSLLAACVEAIGSKNIPAVSHFIAKLGNLASPRGPSALSRLAAYYTEAFALRAARLWPHIFRITVPRELDRVAAASDDDGGSGAAALRILNQVSPIPKFIHFTANEIILRSFNGKDRVHVIDFDIKQGLQWPGLLQSLSARANPPSHVRITGVGDSKQELVETGERLAMFAEALSLPFEFHAVVDRLVDVRLWMLHVKEGEAVAVNCIFQLHKTLYDPTRGAIRDFLGLVRSTNPAALVVAEQEADTNGRSLDARVVASLKHYSAVYDSLHISLSPESTDRARVEEMFGREIRNVVACEGIDRQERHEEFETWRRLMEEEEFECLGVTERERLQAQMILRMYNRDFMEDFRVEERGVRGGGSGGLMLSWQDQPLYTVSAWAPVAGLAGADQVG
ncbi:hypothetical protein SAY86_000990 [Trapa natans]|uniref:Scarecrow-like protein 28 n=1 Tax=Trapa natans TaxID=22666 RepID=A0AAN7RG30_TRANT|nr:hypothetical protein SAY86_000990 [Trapa natans]